MTGNLLLSVLFVISMVTVAIVYANKDSSNKIDTGRKEHHIHSSFTGGKADSIYSIMIQKKEPSSDNIFAK
jgi:hypothetical protein